MNSFDKKENKVCRTYSPFIFVLNIDSLPKVVSIICHEVKEKYLENHYI